MDKSSVKASMPENIELETWLEAEEKNGMLLYMNSDFFERAMQIGKTMLEGLPLAIPFGWTTKNMIAFHAVFHLHKITQASLVILFQ